MTLSDLHATILAMLVRFRLRFQGRVQGVGFRATARRTAQAWPVTGWVRNEPDDSVACEVQGEEASVRGFLESLRVEMGPKIVSCDEQPAAPVEGERGFEIRR